MISSSKAIITSPTSTLDADVINSSSQNRLCVDAVTTIAPGSSQTINSKLRYIDMNVSTNGVARNTSITTTWTTIFQYSGSGKVMSFIINLETFLDWEIRFLVDGEEIYGAAGLSSNDMTGDTIYDLDNLDPADDLIGIAKGAHDRFAWTSPLRLPMVYTTSVEILIKRGAGKASKKFQAGLIVLTKET